MEDSENYIYSLFNKDLKPYIFKNVKYKTQYGKEKELTDILIYFDKSIISIQIKNLRFKNNFERYFKRLLKQFFQVNFSKRNINQIKELKNNFKEIKNFNSNQIKNFFGVSISMGDGEKIINSSKSNLPSNKAIMNSFYVSIEQYDCSNFTTEEFKYLLKIFDTPIDLIGYFSLEFKLIKELKEREEKNKIEKPRIVISLPDTDKKYLINYLANSYYLNNGQFPHNDEKNFTNLIYLDSKQIIGNNDEEAKNLLKNNHEAIILYRIEEYSLNEKLKYKLN